MVTLRQTALLICTGLILLLACSDPVDPEGPERWEGIMTLTTGIGTYADSTKDTISLIVDSPNYTLLLNTRNCNLCDSRGTITDFGKPQFYFTPGNIYWDGNCDSLRVPRGGFEAVFTGDNVVFTNDTSSALNPTWKFRFNLSLKK